MGQETKIQYVHHTFAPWIGCSYLDEGCAHCYAAESTPARAFKVRWGQPATYHRTSAGNWRLPLRWNRAAEKAGERRRVMFSLGDWLDQDVPVKWRDDFAELVNSTSCLAWLLFTKRPENYARLFAAYWELGEHVWPIASCSTQAIYDARLPHLLRIPAKVRGLSLEPLLGPIDLELRHGCRSCNHPGNIIIAWNEHGRCSRCDGTGHEPSGISFVLVGGESDTRTHKARPCREEWIVSIIDQCRSANVACYVKQLGSNYIGGSSVRCNDKKGGEPSEWMPHLRVRELP